jgi:hypothetical protein
MSATSPRQRGTRFVFRARRAARNATRSLIFFVFFFCFVTSDSTKKEQKNKRTKEQKNKRTKEQKNKRTKEQKNKKNKIKKEWVLSVRVLDGSRFAFFSNGFHNKRKKNELLRWSQGPHWPDRA